jgi:hypothetical protein
MPRRKVHQPDISWRMPSMRTCIICGNKFPAVGFRKTCSLECSAQLAAAARRAYYRKNAAKVIAAQRIRWLAKPRECESCHEIYQPRKNSRTCTKPQCRTWLKAQHKAALHQYYLNNPDKFKEYSKTRAELVRTQRVPKRKECVNCGKMFEAQGKGHGKSIFCPDCRVPEIRRRRQNYMERMRYARAIETSRHSAARSV